METRYGVFGGVTGRVSELLTAMSGDVDMFIINGGFLEPTSPRKQHYLLDTAIMELQGTNKPYLIVPGQYDDYSVFEFHLQNAILESNEVNQFAFEGAYNSLIQKNNHNLYSLPGGEWNEQKEIKSRLRSGFVFSTDLKTGLYSYPKKRSGSIKKISPNETIIAPVINFFAKNISELDTIDKANTILLTPTPPLIYEEEFHGKAINLEFNDMTLRPLENEHINQLYYNILGYRDDPKKRDDLDYETKQLVHKLATKTNIPMQRKPLLNRSGSKLLRSYASGFGRIITSAYRQSAHHAHNMLTEVPENTWSDELFVNTGQAIDGKGMIITVNEEQMKYRKVRT